MPERMRYTTTLDRKLIKEIKQLALNKDCRVNDLIEEALLDLLNKNSKKTDCFS